MPEENIKINSDKAIRLFKELVDIKRQQMELKDRYDVLKEFFKTLAAEKLSDGVGILDILDGNGVRFQKKPSSVSKTKLKNAGISENIIAGATGEYIGFEIYTKKE